MPVNEERGRESLRKLPSAGKVLTGDLSSIGETKDLAAQVNSMGSFDAIIHNAGVYQSTGKLILAVNTLAPYILTCMIQKPKRLILSQLRHAFTWRSDVEKSIKRQY